MIDLPGVLALILVAAMAASAAGKLVAWEQTVDWLADVAPSHSPVLLGRVLIAGEFAIALAIVAAPRSGAVAAAVWILGASVVLLVARDRAGDCGCFGTRVRVGWRWAARNGVLVFLACVVVAVPNAEHAPEMLLAGTIVGATVIAARQIPGRRPA